MDESTLHSLLRKGQQYNASDILLKVGQPPAFRVSGVLHYLQGDKLSPQHTRELAEIILKPMKIMERGPSKKRVFERVVDYVATFIKGIAA
jgi:Tfp pilus assembly pilus retraction ATPase PilT